MNKCKWCGESLDTFEEAFDHCVIDGCNEASVDL